MRAIIIISIAFLVLPVLASAQTQVFEGFLFTGESVNVEDQNVLIHVDTRGDRVTVDYGPGQFVVANNTCNAIISITISQLFLREKKNRIRPRSGSAEYQNAPQGV